MFDKFTLMVCVILSLKIHSLKSFDTFRQCLWRFLNWIHYCLLLHIKCLIKIFTYYLKIYNNQLVILGYVRILICVFKCCLNESPSTLGYSTILGFGEGLLMIFYSCRWWFQKLLYHWECLAFARASVSYCLFISWATINLSSMYIRLLQRLIILLLIFLIYLSRFC